MVSVIKKILIFLLMVAIKTSILGQNNASVTISGKFFSRGGVSYGMEISLINLESGITYNSNILSIFKQGHSIIQCLPPGKYRVFTFQYIRGFYQNKIFQQFFGIIELEEGKSYFLGNFIGRTKFSLNAPMIYTIEDTLIPNKVIRTLKKRKLIENEEEIIKTYPYNSDTLRIGVELQR